MKQVLMIEDDRDLARLISMHMEDEHIQLTHCTDGISGLEEAKRDIYQLILLDLMLPKLNGLELCKQLRAASVYTPILMLTSKSEEFDKVLGLEMGADDYLTKPFSVRELIARVKAQFRRSEISAQSAVTLNKWLRFETLSIHLERRYVEVEDNRVELTTKEFELLSLFTQNPGKPFSRQTLLEQVWGYSFEGYEHTVNSHINRLRTKIEKDPANPYFIQTVWGYGYRFLES